MQIGQLTKRTGVPIDANVRETAAVKLADVEHKLNELTRIRDGLRQPVDACPSHGSLDTCPILTALSKEGE